MGSWRGAWRGGNSASETVGWTEGKTVGWTEDCSAVKTDTRNGVRRSVRRWGLLWDQRRGLQWTALQSVSLLAPLKVEESARWRVSLRKSVGGKVWEVWVGETA